MQTGETAGARAWADDESLDPFVSETDAVSTEGGDGEEHEDALSPWQPGADGAHEADAGEAPEGDGKAEAYEAEGEGDAEAYEVYEAYEPEGEAPGAVEPELLAEADSMMRIVERGIVAGRIAAGELDPNELTNGVFYARHPDMRGKRIAAGQTAYAAEWRAILRDIVQPALGGAARGGAPTEAPAAPTDGDAHVAQARRIAARQVPGMPGTTIRDLVERWRVQICPEVPWEVLLAFISYESGGSFTDATHGTARNRFTSPPFYELGLFQTPAGLHGTCTSGDAASCENPPPGREDPRSPSPWARLCKRIGADPSRWTDPTTQVRVGLRDLEDGARAVRAEFPELFPRPGADWDLRMAVLYRFSRGGGAARSFLRPQRAALAAMPEERRWAYLRDQVRTVRVAGGTRAFHGENVDEKMALAARLRGAPAGTSAPAQPPRAPALSPGSTPPGAPRSAAGGARKGAPFAVPSPRGMNLRGGERRKPVYGLVVHTTGSGPATIAADPKKAAKWGISSAVECALAIYANGDGFPHYLIGYDGTIYLTCPEDHVAWHAGWTKKIGGADRWRSWTAPAWWSRVWGAGKTPLDLMPAGAASPNSRHVGVELLGSVGDTGFTDAQYRSLARLVMDVDRQYGIGIDRAPSTKLLGHEDVNPLTGEGGRANAKGGWDPGAHRVEGAKPIFSWPTLWALVQKERGAVQRELEGDDGPADSEAPFLAELDGWAPELAAG